MIGAPNSLNLNCKVRVMKEAPGPSVSEETADIFTNYNIDTNIITTKTKQNKILHIFYEVYNLQRDNHMFREMILKQHMLSYFRYFHLEALSFF